MDENHEDLSCLADFDGEVIVVGGGLIGRSDQENRNEFTKNENLYEYIDFEEAWRDFLRAQNGYRPERSKPFRDSPLRIPRGSTLNSTRLGDGVIQNSPTELDSRPILIRKARAFLEENFRATSGYSDGKSSEDELSERQREVQDLLARAPHEFNYVLSQLVPHLESCSTKEQKEAATQISLLAKSKSEYRSRIAQAGVVDALVRLLSSSDPEVGEHVVRAILNLSLCDENKPLIASSGAIKPLIRVLESGTCGAKENAAFVLAQLSKVGNYRVVIGESGAIPPLVSLLKNGRPQGKKDALAALYLLLLEERNVIKAIQAGVIRPLLELMADEETLGNKSACVLDVLARIPEARTHLVVEGGIPVLVWALGVGSEYQKETVVTLLSKICEDFVVYRNMIAGEGAVPILDALSWPGNEGAKEKAKTLIKLLGEPRSGQYAAETSMAPTGTHASGHTAMPSACVS